MSTLARHLGISRYRADEHYQAALRAFAGRDLPRAIVEIQFAIDLLPKHAEYQGAYGFFLLENKERAEAVKVFESALELNAYDMMANYGLGMVAYRAKNWRSAGDYFMNALAAQPARPETQYYLAMVQHRLGQNGEALRWMEAAGTGFAKAEDRRQRHCTAWIREFEKLLKIGEES